MDKKFKEKYGCYCPIRTKFPGVKDCPLEKLSLDQKLQAWSKYSITINNLDLYYHIYIQQYLISEDFRSITRLSNEMCIKPCASMGVYFGVPIWAPNGYDENLAYAKLYFKTEINVRRSQLAYTTISLFGELGGYVGLLLGISFMDITTLIERMIMYFSNKN